MRNKTLMTLVALLMAFTASAQIELLYHYTDKPEEANMRNVIDRNKKLFWMDGDDDPCYNITNYSKNGNKESFTLIEKESSGYGEAITVKVNTELGSAGQTVKITYKYSYSKTPETYNVTNETDVREHNRLVRYFNELAGNPPEQGVINEGLSVGGGDDSPAPAVETPSEVNEVNKVTDTAKDAVNKVKGLFKKKK